LKTLIRKTQAAWKSPATLVSLALLGIALLVRTLPSTPYVYNDEVGAGYTGYGYTAWGYFDTANIYARYLRTGDFLGLFNWSFQFGSLSPLTPLFAALAILSGPTLNPIVAARIPVTIASSLTSVIVYWIGRDIFDQRTGIVAGLLFAIDPVSVLSGRVLYEDALAVFFVSITLFLIQHNCTISRRTLILAALSMALALSSKLLAVSIVPTILLGNVRWGLLPKAAKSGLKGGLQMLAYLPWQRIVLTLALSSALFLAAFPWLGPVTIERFQLLYQRTYLAGQAPSGIVLLSGPYFQNPVSSLVVLTLIREDPWEIVFGAFGGIYLLQSLVRPRLQTPSLGKSLAGFWALSVFAILLLSRPIYPHYLLYAAPVLSLFSSLGVWKTVDWTIRRLSRLKGHIRNAMSAKILLIQPGKLVGWALVAILVIPAMLPLAFNLNAPGLYYSPAIGGIEGASRIVQISGEEALPVVARYISENYMAGSTILVFGQPQLLKYLLPEYQVVGTNEFYPFYVSNPIAFFLYYNISAIVVQSFEQQVFPSDSLIVALRNSSATLDVSYQGLSLARLYSTRTLGSLQSDWNAGPPYQGWMAYQGTFGSNGTLQVGAQQSYVFVASPPLYHNASCVNTASVLVPQLSGNIKAFRIEFVNSTGQIISTNYIDIRQGLNIGRVQGLASPQNATSLRLVLVGGEYSFVTIAKVTLSCLS